jgi:hypothetical protein
VKGATTLKERVINNLSEYDYIKKYLGNIIEQRLAIEDYEHGMLTAQLLDEHYKSDLQRLQDALKLGESNCGSFKRIFHIGKLPQAQDITDARILDMLAEVRTIEFLATNNFENINYLLQKGNGSTVDFSSRRYKDIFAIEVTRIGLPQSPKKKGIVLAEDTTRIRLRNGEHDITWFLISGRDNLPQFRKTIGDAIDAKYSQIKQFCQTRKETYKGVIAISFGRDYFVTKNARRDLTMFPDRIKEVTETIWKEQKNAYDYLDYVIFLLGKKLDKAFVYPDLPIEGISTYDQT